MLALDSKEFRIEFLARRRDVVTALGLGAVLPLVCKTRILAKGAAGNSPLAPSAELLAQVAQYAKSLYPTERPARSTTPPNESRFIVNAQRKKQVILGLGCEIQCDGIRSANQGLDDLAIGVPHDLIPSERVRLYREMLAGFRYCRLAGGLYLRGMDRQQKYLRPRWPEQFAELREMFSAARIEGGSFEYWSPLPYWKANRRYMGDASKPWVWDDPENVLRCFGPHFASDEEYRGDTARFLRDFAEACKQDLTTLRTAGIPISFWGLQNEPFTNAPYSSCAYTNESYARTFEAVAPIIRQFDPKITIIADTGVSWDFSYVRSVLNDPSKAHLVDALAIHLMGVNSNAIRPPVEPSGKSRFNNEFEYLENPATAARCLNTVQNVMNWFQLADAPTWFWLHALKPLQNTEASGYSLGFWRPLSEAAPEKGAHYPALKPGHWIWNKYNWNAVGSFVRHLPWNSISVHVDEVDSSDDDLRIMAFTRPDGKLTVVVSNRSFASHTFRVSTADTFRVSTARSNKTFRGFRYTPEEAGENCRGIIVGELAGPDIAPLVPDLAWEFWEEQ
jgi:O-glycosyl hydrolase